MRTELEFSMKFIVDPAEPVSEHEMRALAGMYEVLRSLQSPPSQLNELQQLVERVRAAPGRPASWPERQRLARDTLAQCNDKYEAARALDITTNELMKWLAGRPPNARAIERTG